MLFVTLIVFSSLLFFLIIMMLIAGDYEHLLKMLSLTACILIIPISSINNHVRDLALIRKGQQLVQVREQAIKDIDEQLKSFKIANTALMNADSPAASLISTKAKFVSQLAESKVDIVQAKIDIEARSIGLMSVVVKIFGKE